ncbi:hypothetical protein B0H14DRAFT_2281066, partial [Mycena olivaceomarginata]
MTHTQPNNNFCLPAGVWMGNTSMTPALARSRSITTFDAGGGGGGDKGKQGKGGMDAADQLDAYYRWRHAGELSTMGRCFGVGGAIRRAGAVRGCAEWHRKAAAAVLPRIGHNLSGSVFGRNGSLMRMRVLPVGLTYRRKEEGKVGDLARESSRTTHPNVVCQEACAVWATCIVRVVHTAAVAERMQEGLGMMKLDVLHHFALF